MADAGGNELHTYFCAVGELRRATALGVDQDEIRLLIEEINCIVLHTDNSTLRERCKETLREFAPERAAELA